MSKQVSEKAALYAGTFDPITNGHIDIIERALKIFDCLYVGVAADTSKNTIFSTEERVGLVKGALDYFPAELKPRIKVESFQGLLVEYVRKVGAVAVIRGLRAVSDYEYEAQMAHINRGLAEEIETVFLVTSSHCSFISSSVVKDIARNGGDVSHLVPANVLAELSKHKQQL